MRVYGVLQTRFWTHPEIQVISDQAKLLAIYLLSSSHTNMCGCFRIPIGYISEDLKWPPEKVIQAFAELSRIHFLTRDDKSDWLLINNFLKFHPVENPNQAKSIEALFNKIPSDLFFVPELIKSLITHAKHLKSDFRNRLETVSQPFLNQEQNQEQKQNQKIKDMSGKPDVSIVPDNKKLREQAISIIDFLSEKSERKYRHAESTIKKIVARLRSGATVMDCRQIIAKKSREWKKNKKMNKYIRPKTIFNEDNFEDYYGEIAVPIEENENDRMS